MSTLHLLASEAAVLAVDIQPVIPPGGDRIVTVLGYVMWGIALAFLAAFAVACVMAAWAHHQGHSGQAGGRIVIVLVLAAIFGGAGQLMTPLVG